MPIDNPSPNVEGVMAIVCEDERMHEPAGVMS